VPRLTWDNAGSRFYEIGIDRGVLYVGNQPGVSWSGLTAVTETVSGGAAKPYYLDGVKYLNLATGEEFQATLDAFTYPDEFGPCDGIVSAQNGLFATAQKRTPFNLTYRTGIGNDVTGSTYAYKIHVVYNALATPSQRAYKTMSDSPTLDTMSWSISTAAVPNLGYKPTAHFVIDSRSTLPFRLSTIEDILYGNTVATASLPTPQALVNLFDESGFPPLRAVQIGTNAYKIQVVADPTTARAVASPFHPQPPTVGEDPIVWFDTSSGSYGKPKLVMGG
jgi:hypothetical protein